MYYNLLRNVSLGRLDLREQATVSPRRVSGGGYLPDPTRFYTCPSTPQSCLWPIVTLIAVISNSG